MKLASAINTTAYYIYDNTLLQLNYIVYFKKSAFYIKTLNKIENLF